MSNFTKTESGREIALGMQALKRIAQPDDIGDVIAFLASPEARWITGDMIPCRWRIEALRELIRFERGYP